jgi:hypothetical protein
MWMIIALKNILPFNVFYEYLFGQVHSSLRGTKQSPDCRLCLEIASSFLLTMTKNRTTDYEHINRPFFFVFFPLFPGEAGVESRNDEKFNYRRL